MLAVPGAHGAVDVHRQATPAVVELQGQMKPPKSIQEQFMAALEPYAQGKSLLECEKQSGLKGAGNYLSKNGKLQINGKAISKLPPELRSVVDAALICGWGT